MASILDDIEGFDWDEGNSNKNWHRHRVTDAEGEQVFSNEPILIGRDLSHSDIEDRYAARGVTDAERRLTVIFTIRRKQIRVISARDMTQREERKYEEKIKRDS
ncbi:MAG: BrnT family toxin [Acidobacteria bacterium]|nr:BrnT family toxin [Acidobacteriota bacterium]